MTLLIGADAAELQNQSNRHINLEPGIAFGDFSIQESQRILSEANATIEKEAVAIDTTNDIAVVKKYSTWADALKDNASGGTAPPAKNVTSASLNGESVKEALSFEEAMQQALLHLDIHAPGTDIKKRGLVNQGNTCFQNVIMQSMLACPPFLNLLIHISRNVLESEELAASTATFKAWRYMVAFIREFEEPTVAQLQCDVKKARATPSKKRASGAIRIRRYFMEVLGAFQRFRGDEEDALEFLEFFLDFLHSEYEQSGLRLPANCIIQIEPENIGPSTVSVSKDPRTDSEWAEVGKKGKSNLVRKNLVDICQSPINWLFKGSLRSEVKQTGRKQHTITIEPFHCLHLDLDHHLEISRLHSVPGTYERNEAHIKEPGTLKPVALEDMMQNAFSVEAIDTLNSQPTLTKGTSMECLPTVLTINIKRFTYHPEHGPVKLQQAVAYPGKFRFPLKYMSTSCRAEYEAQYKKSTNSMARNSSKPVEAPVYQLNAVVSHHGGSVAGGHYTCVCRDNKDQWFHYDDERVTLINEATALQENAYLLFYSRSNGSGSDTEIIEQLVPHSKSWSEITSLKSSRKDESGDSRNKGSSARISQSKRAETGNRAILKQA